MTKQEGVPDAGFVNLNQYRSERDPARMVIKKIDNEIDRLEHEEAFLRKRNMTLATEIKAIKEEIDTRKEFLERLQDGNATPQEIEREISASTSTPRESGTILPFHSSTQKAEDTIVPDEPPTVLPFPSDQWIDPKERLAARLNREIESLQEKMQDLEDQEADNNQAHTNVEDTLTGSRDKKDKLIDALTEPHILEQDAEVIHPSFPDKRAS